MTDKVWVPERWDVGRWDEAHWDGQLGFNAHKGSVVVHGTTATLSYTNICHPATGAIVITPQVVGLHFNRRLTAGTGQVRVRANRPSLYVTNWPPPPGIMEFGRTVYIEKRW